MAVHVNLLMRSNTSTKFKFQIHFVMFRRGAPGTPIDPAPVLLSGIHCSTSHIALAAAVQHFLSDQLPRSLEVVQFGPLLVVPTGSSFYRAKGMPFLKHEKRSPVRTAERSSSDQFSVQFGPPSRPVLTSPKKGSI